MSLYDIETIADLNSVLDSKEFNVDQLVGLTYNQVFADFGVASFGQDHDKPYVLDPITGKRVIQDEQEAWSALNIVEAGLAAKVSTGDSSKGSWLSRHRRLSMAFGAVMAAVVSTAGCIGDGGDSAEIDEEPSAAWYEFDQDSRKDLNIFLQLDSVDPELYEDARATVTLLPNYDARTLAMLEEYPFIAGDISAESYNFLQEGKYAFQIDADIDGDSYLIGIDEDNLFPGRYILEGNFFEAGKGGISEQVNFSEEFVVPALEYDLMVETQIEEEEESNYSIQFEAEFYPQVHYKAQIIVTKDGEVIYSQDQTEFAEMLSNKDDWGDIPTYGDYVSPEFMVLGHRRIHGSEGEYTFEVSLEDVLGREYTVEKTVNVP